jgi:hypothetical protein
VHNRIGITTTTVIFKCCYPITNNIIHNHRHHNLHHPFYENFCCAAIYLRDVLPCKEYWKRKKQKLEAQYEDDAGGRNAQGGSGRFVREDGRPTLIFSGVRAYVNGLTNPSYDELKILVGRQGGKTTQHLTGDCTHIIATSMSQQKIKMHLKLKIKNGIPIVKPAWVTESLKEVRSNYHQLQHYATQTHATKPRLSCFL